MCSFGWLVRGLCSNQWKLPFSLVLGKQTLSFSWKSLLLPVSEKVDVIICSSKMPPKKKPRPEEGQRTLFAFTQKTVSSMRPLSETEISVSESSATSDRDAQPSTSKQNEQATWHFQVGWLYSYPWLSYENGLMHCKQCRELKFTNTMAQGTNNFRTNTLTRHVSGSDHQWAVAAPNEQKRMSVAAEKALSKEEEAVQVAMKAVFWLCQESLPLHKYQSLLSFLRLLNVPHIEHLQCGEKTNYSSTTSAHGLLQVLSDIVDESITQKVNESPVITLFTDESTDIVVSHKLAISVRVVDPFMAHSHPNILSFTHTHKHTYTRTHSYTLCWIHKWRTHDNKKKPSILFSLCIIDWM